MDPKLVSKDTNLYPTFNDLLYFKDEIEKFRPDRKDYTRSLYADRYLNSTKNFKNKEELTESLQSLFITKKVYHPDKKFYLGRRPNSKDSKVPEGDLTIKL